jgi:GDP/UDP-N,N'-diacetylbacillosamine 2-epimerase (hydrolysing)
MKRKIAVVTVSRAEYGILKKLLHKLQEDQEIELQLIVTGSHLMNEAGMTINQIKEDNISIAAEIDMELHGDQPHDISNAMGTIIKKMGKVLQQLQPDLMILISDRFETGSAGLASLPFNIPIVHIAGGVVTEGAIDDKIRHSLTKMSQIHCAVDQEGANNLISMGEEAWRVHNTGSMSIDLLQEYATKSEQQLKEELHIESTAELMLFVYHPTTTEYQQTEEQITNALDALPDDMEIIALLPNQDTARNTIAQALTKKAEQSQHIHVFKHLPRSTYANVMKQCRLMVGNSSSGLLEAPTFQTPVVNIGNRQRGRGRCANIIDTDYETDNIKKGIKKARSAEFKSALSSLINPFGDGNATEKIYTIIKEIEINERLLNKKIGRT